MPQPLATNIKAQRQVNFLDESARFSLKQIFPDCFDKVKNAITERLQYEQSPPSKDKNGEEYWILCIKGKYVKIILQRNTDDPQHEKIIIKKCILIVLPKE